MKLPRIFQRKACEEKAAAAASPRPSGAEAFTFEAAREDLAAKSEARAWRCAAGLGVLLALEAAALIALLPLKSSVPFVVQVDRSTGESVVLPIANTREIPASEAQDKYWLGQYVLARESYDYRTLENDYIKTRELSTRSVFEPYASQFGQKEGSLEKLYGDSREIRVKLLSVVPNGNGVATVRFSKTLRSTRSGLEEKESRWTATLGYEYHPEFKATEASRLVNPFGFRVTSYRVDEEVGREPEAPKEAS
ncbi:type IV secretion system protein [Mesosutterella sp. AGMB02718]|uniref:Type IV secretion system protein n=1 Tax=Mesosutterella faecium TaxID=2925194 RepID=A0ABT7INS7_9BURK|nr:type IV secretion system protein [Mesosutterella sp. AGMB02718]MDL2060037.1 type IV secretion system protein [Mesosutterella sp. AGMB02718]